MSVDLHLPLRHLAQGRWLIPFLIAALLSSLALTPLYAQSEPQSDSAPTISDAELIREINAYVGQQFAEGKFSGTVLIAKEGEPIYQQAFGLASIAYQVPNRIDTKFNLGSMNKMFTAVAIAQLAEQGKLSFDDPISTHLPDYPNAEVAENVTIHHLLTHTSGLADYFNDKFVEASRARFRTIEDFFPLFVDEPLQFEPGSEWSYSNSNFIVSGAIIEAVSGQNYFDYVREHIYEPAGMSDTDAYELDRETPNLATGYTRARGGNELRNNLFEHVIKGGPAGGGYSTAADLLAFAQALLANELLNDEMTTLVTEPKVAAQGPFDAHYGYGFMHETLNGYHRFGHSGGFEGISSELNIYPELGYVVVILSNFDPPAAPLVSLRIGKLLTGMEIPQAIKLPPADVLTFGNSYSLVGEAAGPGTLELEEEDGALWLILGPDNRHRFLPLSATEFYDEEYEDVRIQFIVDEQGETAGFTMVGISPEVLEYTVASEE
jgi:CubicO group peptidase (beta-lactamase class C family)